MARGGFDWRKAALVAIAVLAAGVVGTLLASEGGEPAHGSAPAPPCPAGFLDQIGRGDRLRRLLGSTEEGRALLERVRATEVRICFGPIDVPVVTDDRVLLLDSRGDDAELAARTGHLLAHVADGAPFPAAIPADADCEHVVRDALAREAAAYALEIRLRRELGVAGRRYAFEDAYVATDAGERAILAYLVAHPEGGPGLDPLGSAYRQRCEVGRAAAAR